MKDIQGRVLFVGNDQELGTLLIKILNRKGCQVTVATVATALKMIANEEYDCVVIDWVGDYERNREFDKVIACLARELPVTLFTGIVSGEEGKLTRKNVGEKNYPLLSFDSLVREVLQDVHRKI